jgi:hypothetical protein
MDHKFHAARDLGAIIPWSDHWHTQFWSTFTTSGEVDQTNNKTVLLVNDTSDRVRKPRLEGRRDLKITGPRLVPAAAARVALAEEAVGLDGLRVPDGRRARGRVAGRPLERPVLPSAAAGLGLLAFVSAHLWSLRPPSVISFCGKNHSSARDCSHSVAPFRKETELTWTLVTVLQTAVDP